MLHNSEFLMDIFMKFIINFDHIRPFPNFLFLLSPSILPQAPESFTSTFLTYKHTYPYVILYMFMKSRIQT